MEPTFDPDAELGPHAHHAPGHGAGGVVVAAGALRRGERLLALLVLLVLALLVLLAYQQQTGALAVAHLAHGCAADPDAMAYAVATAVANTLAHANANAALKYYSNNYTSNQQTGGQRTDDPPARSFACSWLFKAYHPSAWESEWQQLVRQHESTKEARICPLLLDDYHWPRVVASVGRVQRLTEGKNKLHLRLINTTANGASSSAFLSPRHSFSIGSRSWSEAEFRVHADVLLSRMEYELVCRDVSAAGARPKADPFVVARGYDTIEPLVGLLRDSMTICNKNRAAPLPPALKPFMAHADASGDVQSKRFILLASASIFHFRMLAAADSGAAQWPVGFDAATLSRIHTAIYAQAKTSGVSPWMWQTSQYSRPLAPPDAASWPYIHMPLQEERGQRLSVVQPLDVDTVLEGTTALPDVGILLQAQAQPEITQSELAQSVMVHVPSDRAQAAIVDFRALDDRLAAARLDLEAASRHRGRTAPRMLLFDLGASYFGGWNDDPAALGTAWLTRVFSAKGYFFDHVYAFEFEDLKAKKQWSQIPKPMHAGFTWINAGVSADPSNAENVWNWLLATARPSDFVVVKLDIDTSEIEVPLIEQLIAQPHLAALVDEMFFEHHTSIQESMSHNTAAATAIAAAATAAVAIHWGSSLPRQPQPLRTSYDYFSKLRTMGVRMHSWP